VTDPLFQMLERLPAAEPDPAHAARVRARCHRVLARQSPRPSPRNRQAARIWVPFAIALSGFYLIESFREVLHVYALR
jgi:hypothetical protein